MAFIRVKNIKGHSYAYLVSNTWTGRGARQKVGKYLGKLHRPQKKLAKGLKEFVSAQDMEKYFEEKQMKEIIADLVKLEIHNHGMADSFFVEEDKLKALNGKEAVIAANSGYICNDTIKMLHSYNPDGDDGYMLAIILTAAGISVEQEVFVMLYEKAKGTQSAPSGEFYY